MQATVLVSLLQPPPETFDLFHDLILLADGSPGTAAALIATRMLLLLLLCVCVRACAQSLC